jgi:hypothetical protein
MPSTDRPTRQPGSRPSAWCMGHDPQSHPGASRSTPSGQCGRSAPRSCSPLLLAPASSRPGCLRCGRPRRRGRCTCCRGPRNSAARTCRGGGLRVAAALSAGSARFVTPTMERRSTGNRAPNRWPQARLCGTMRAQRDGLQAVAPRTGKRAASFRSAEDEAGARSVEAPRPEPRGRRRRRCIADLAQVKSSPPLSLRHPPREAVPGAERSLRVRRPTLAHHGPRGSADLPGSLPATLAP